MAINSESGRVSVILCTYNGEKYLREQLDSIVAQTYPIYELIIQDDKSTDRTMDIAHEYAGKYSFIRVLQNERNLGFNDNFKTAAMRATGDFIAISDQDDIWYPQKIEKQIAAIGDHDICFCCHERGRERDHSVYVTPQYSLKALLFNGFAGHTMLLRTDFAQDAGNWIDYVHYDWSLAINAQLHHGIIRIDEPLNWHRTHDDSAIAEEQRKFGKSFSAKPTYQPYLYGFGNYRRMQKKENWQRLYRYIYEKTRGGRLTTEHRMCRMMLSSNPFSLFHLCTACMKYRKEIYYNNSSEGLKGIVRGFFYPLIFVYKNVQYDL